MNTIHPDTIEEIMKALDEGTSVQVLVSRFPEHQAAIKEVAEARGLIERAAATVPEPVIKLANNRSYQERAVENPSIINSLVFGMNYKIALPVLVLGLVVVGGATLFTNKGNQVATTTEGVPYTQTPAQTQGTPDNTASGTVDEILAGFSADISSEQLAYADDGVSVDMFAQSELASLESETYDY